MELNNLRPCRNAPHRVWRATECLPALQDKMMQPGRSNRRLHACTQSLLTHHHHNMLSCLQDKVMGVNMRRQEDDYQHTVKGEAVPQRPGLICSVQAGLQDSKQCTLRMTLTTARLGSLRPGCSSYQNLGALRDQQGQWRGASPLDAGIELRVSVFERPPCLLGLPCLLGRSTAPAIVQGPTLLHVAERCTLCRAFVALSTQLQEAQL